MRTAVFVFMCWSLALPVSAQDKVATLTGVATIEDGDGVLFGRVEVRLQGIAAPELSDPMGRESYLAPSEGFCVGLL